MRNSFALAAVLNLFALLGLVAPALALDGGCTGCGYGGFDYGAYGCSGWINAGYLYGGGCPSGPGYGHGIGGYGYDWRFGGKGSGEGANGFSVVPAHLSAAAAPRSVAQATAIISVEAEFENRIVAAAQRVLRPSIAGPAATFVARADAAPSSRNPDLAEALAGEARHFYWQRNYQASLKVLEEAVRADEHSASAWVFQGLCHRALGNAAAAEASFAKGVAYYPTDSAGERRMSQILQRVQGSLRAQLENARLKLRRDAATAPAVVTASR